ncbi:MAG: ferric reductase-like transmembrane domain-containing protein [Polaromonas sp.]
MKRIKLTFWALLAMCSAVWLLADTLLPATLDFFSLRSVFIQFTGVLGIGAMSAAMWLAARPKWLEPRLDGLDKMYRLHKWLGIAALVLAVTHWLWAQGAKWMVGWGWLVRPARVPRVQGEGLGPVEQFLRSQRGLAESLGEWAFYAAVVLIALALIKRFPYRQFVKLHQWLAVVYLVLVFHSVVLMKFSYWTQPIGAVMALLMAGGVVAALLALSGRIGAGRRTRGTIESLTYYPELRVLETAIKLQDGWRGHEAGQFAFVTSDRREGAHPYTIASAWTGDGRIVFITKALGDHTSRLQQRLKTGDEVNVEGPYGCFTFTDQHPRQIWVGGGIGITPFVARLKALANTPGHQVIDLFHTTADYEQAAIDKLEADARAANVRLHLLVNKRDGRLDAARIRTAVPEWQSASVWFCGPGAFGQALRRDFMADGLAPDDFHQELFEMR